MADEVVDIRKRIEEMRNEVSAAIVSNRELFESSRALGKAADISISKVQESGADEHRNNTNSSEKNEPISDDTLGAHKGLDNALKMPAFQLNVRNQLSHRLLLTMIGIQVFTNILLILMVWLKLGQT